MKKKICCFYVFLCCSGFCTAQQVVSSGGYAEESEVSVDWIIGGSLMDISGFDLGFFAGEQMKQLMESAFSLKVYPNPATELLNVEISPTDTCQILIELIDLQGKVLYNKTLKNEPVMQVDIKDFAEGSYYLKVTQVDNDQLFSVEKIIKIKN